MELFAFSLISNILTVCITKVRLREIKNKEKNNDISSPFLSLKMYLPNPSARAERATRVILSGFYLVWIQSLPPDWPVTIPTLKSQVCHSWRENTREHSFPKYTSALWNANSLIQDLNSSHCVSPLILLAQSAGGVEYTDWTSAEE